MFYNKKCHQIVIFNQLGGHQFFKELKGSVSQKRLKNTALEQGSQARGPPDAFMRPTNISQIDNIINFDQI
jgi:hypothetical protein